MAAAFALGSLTFPSGEMPSEGEVEWVQPQNWSEFEPIGASTPGTLLTYLSSPSITQTLTAYVRGASRDTLTTMFNARAAVTWTTPWDSTGYSVYITKLSIKKDRSVRGTDRWKATFTIVKAS